MRAMSFMLTTAQIIDESKDVTRRIGWEFLRPGERLRAVEKCMGLKKGEKQRQLKVIEVVSVTRVCLDNITQEDVVREGFAEMTPDDFVEMFCKSMKCNRNKIVQRIEFKYVTESS